MKKRYVFWAKCSNQLSDNEISQWIIKRFSYEIKRFLRTGKKPINVKYPFIGLEGDDFVRMKKTVCVYFNLIKIPRFANPIYK